jgi:uncharacterized RDD family membrane protein YckC
MRPNPTPSMTVDREATARALEITTEPSARPQESLPPLEELRTRERPELKAEPVAAARATAAKVIQAPVAEPLAAASAVAAKAVPTKVAEPLSIPYYEPDIDEVVSGARPISIAVRDEIEPLDYLQAEVQKISRSRDQEFEHNESPSFAVHAVIGLIDLCTVVLSASPFMAVIQIMNGSISEPRTQLAGGLIVLLVSFFYLAVTQCLSGKTFGMMMTNTRVVDSRTLDPPSGQRILLRTIGYFVAIAPALLGVLWIAWDRKRRGWHDLLSGTRVVRDF